MTSLGDRCLADVMFLCVCSYQLVGVNFLTLLARSGVGGAIMADEMGLGKTAQAIAFLGRPACFCMPDMELFSTVTLMSLPCPVQCPSGNDLQTIREEMSPLAAKVSQKWNLLQGFAELWTEMLGRTSLWFQPVCLKTGSVS